MTPLNSVSFAGFAALLREPLLYTLSQALPRRSVSLPCFYNFSLVTAALLTALPRRIAAKRETC